MTDITPKSDRLVATYLAEHPEYAAEFGYHQGLGPVMTAAGLDLFVDWAVERGHIKSANRAKAKALMAAANRLRSEDGR